MAAVRGRQKPPTTPPPSITSRSGTNAASIIQAPVKRSPTTGSSGGGFAPFTGHRTLVKAGIVGVLGIGVIRFVLLLDLDKRVFNHKPGTCRGIRNLGPLSGDLEYVPDLATVFISQPGSRLFEPLNTSTYVGHISILKLERNEKGEPEVTSDSLEPVKLRIELGSGSTTFNRTRFLPMGLSVGTAGKRTLVYVVNARGNGVAAGDGNGGHTTTTTVEVFTYMEKTGTLYHVKTIQHQSFHSLTDIAVLDGGNRFVAINGFYFGNMYLRYGELAMQLRSGDLVLYDGKNVKVIDNAIASPMAVALDKERGYLYVSSFSGETIKAYSIEQDLSIKHVTDVLLMSAPHGLSVDPKTGDVWTIAQPVMHQTLRQVWDVYTGGRLKRKTGTPSHVLRIRFQDENRSSWVLTEPFANDGTGLPGGTGLAVVTGTLVMTSASKKAVVCEMNNYGIA
uniref:Six-bladed beta-propeller, TolB-like protein n=1 Tax=Panagrellus redivivus TaxID=6233 RepID=A0A7E4VUM8_PANRE